MLDPESLCTTDCERGSLTIMQPITDTSFARILQKELFLVTDRHSIAIADFGLSDRSLKPHLNITAERAIRVARSGALSPEFEGSPTPNIQTTNV